MSSRTSTRSPPPPKHPPPLGNLFPNARHPTIHSDQRNDATAVCKVALREALQPDCGRLLVSPPLCWRVQGVLNCLPSLFAPPRGFPRSPGEGIPDALRPLATPLLLSFTLRGDPCVSPSIRIPPRRGSSTSRPAPSSSTSGSRPPTKATSSSSTPPSQPSPPRSLGCLPGGMHSQASLLSPAG